MSTTTNVMLTLNYEDATTRNVTFKDVDAQALPNIATKVKAINANMSQNFKGTFVSDNGAPVMKIGKAQVIQTEETVIYSE